MLWLVVALRQSLFAVCLLAVTSFVVAIGWTLNLHNADSLIPIFESLDFWLPFYWGQDRFGMLLPLLALPIRNSFWNLIAQNAIGVFLLLVGAYLAARRCGDVSQRSSRLLCCLYCWRGPPRIRLFNC